MSGHRTTVTGGNTEEEQAEFLGTIWQLVENRKLPVAGMVVHEYLDAWWKFGLKDSFKHEEEDVEEWFGLTAIEKTENFYKTKFRKSYFALQEAWQGKREGSGVNLTT